MYIYPMNYNEGKSLIIQKVEDFLSNKEEYLSHHFHEASARARFIDPLFIALGWNFEQTDLKMQQWDVLREYSDHSTTKRPDYAFRINGELKFFVEAKAPWVPLTKKEPVFQAKRYAFSTNGKAPIVILTDFEEFRVFNALKKPNIDLPLEGVLKQYDLTYEKYLDKWDLLYEHFSREAVADGALDELKGKLTKKTKTLDKEFLEEITQWREVLARNLALRNTSLTVDQLNVSVQRILDRLIFIRNLEDRQIEAEGRLLSIAETKTDIYSKLVPVFRKLNREYNGLLFKQHFSEKLMVDDKLLSHIIKHLSWPLSPYQFDVIEPEILGRIYEKFLGSKIRLTAGHRAKVEEKPEVRKAGGVYYTPQYIVDYIVKNTVGEKVKGKTPDEITQIKIVDPACGSGSFLLGAFEYLMNTHEAWYQKNRKKRKYKDDWYLTADGDIRLSVAKKADILKNNIFGVDIDREATEVAVMSLYLKLLDEGFDKGQAMLFLKGHILPDMSSNIKCGNSLIGSDYFDGQNISLFDSDEAKKVNAFDWDVEFPDVFIRNTKGTKNTKGPDHRNDKEDGLVHRSGSVDGFDCVIGNPPYGALFTNEEKDYLKNYYATAEYQFDSYPLFIQCGMNLLNKNGYWGMIIPNPWLTNLMQKGTRKYVLQNSRIDQILHFLDKVFNNVTVDTQIVILEKTDKRRKMVRVKIIEKNSKESIIEKNKQLILHNQNSWDSNGEEIINIFLNEKEKILTKKIKNTGMALDNYFAINVGIKPYQKGKGKPPQSKEIVSNRIYDSSFKKNLLYRQYLRGKDIFRYVTNPIEERFIKYGKWLAEPRPSADFDFSRKIFMRQTGDSLIGTSDYKKYLCLNNMHVLVPNDNSINEKYFLGIINSNLMNWYYHSLNPEIGEALAEVKKTNVARLPIIYFDFDNKKDKSRHDQMVAYVDTMLKLNKKLPSVKTEHEKTVIQRQINATDRKIDKLVYELYDLTEAEIGIVEESVGK